jgi:hypothetical protein
MSYPDELAGIVRSENWERFWKQIKSGLIFSNAVPVHPDRYSQKAWKGNGEGTRNFGYLVMVMVLAIVTRRVATLAF